MAGYTATGPKVTSDWLNEFQIAYTAKKGISDSAMQSRVRHSIDELINIRAIEAHLIAEKIAKVVVVDLGKLIMPYIVK
jgi:hypothetical protein